MLRNASEIDAKMQYFLHAETDVPVKGMVFSLSLSPASPPVSLPPSWVEVQLVGRCTT